MLGTILGMRLLDMFMKKYNRQSPIVFLLTGMLGISALLIPVFGVLDLAKKGDLRLQLPTLANACKVN